jgi:hypothetical protein
VCCTRTRGKKPWASAWTTIENEADISAWLATHDVSTERTSTGQ